jgi:hypothetical protein
MPAGCIDCVITNPPYFSAVTYEGNGSAWSSYQTYLDDLGSVWAECARVLRPNPWRVLDIEMAGIITREEIELMVDAHSRGTCLRS